MALPEVDDELIDAFPIFGIPSVVVDRSYETFLPQEMRSEIDRRSSLPPPVDIVFDSQFSLNHRTATVDIDLHFHTQTSGDLRTNCVLAEDPVVGSGDGYDQHSNYNDTPGHPYYQAGDPIPNYPHRFVSRVFMDGVWGSAGTIPDPALAGQVYETTLNANVPAEVDENKTWVVCYVAHEGEAAGDRVVLDATWAPLGDSSPSPPMHWDYLETSSLSRWSSVSE
jgi:hypothetical protein